MGEGRGAAEMGIRKMASGCNKREKFEKKGCPGIRVSGRQSERKGGRRLGSSYSGR